MLILQVYDRQLTPTNHLLMIWIKLGNNRINFLHFEKRTIIFGWNWALTWKKACLMMLRWDEYSIGKISRYNNYVWTNSSGFFLTSRFLSLVNWDFPILSKIEFFNKIQPATLTWFGSSNLKMTILEFGNVNINEEDHSALPPR